MNKATLVLAVALVFGVFGLASCDSGSTLSTDEDLCQAVFETIQNDDFAAFSGLFLTEESVATIAASLEEGTAKQKEIKEEMLTFDTDEIDASAKSFFDKIKTEAAEDGLDLKNGSYQGIVQTKDRFTVPNLTCKTVYFEISFETMNYIVEIDLLKSLDGFSVYETVLRTFSRVDISFVSPEENPVVVSLGSDLDYEVAFDAEAANAEGAWIQIVFDGKNARMIAGTTIESPFRANIGATFLSAGTHTLACRLHPSGSATTYPIGEAVLNIEVK